MSPCTVFVRIFLYGLLAIEDHEGTDNTDAFKKVLLLNPAEYVDGDPCKVHEAVIYTTAECTYIALDSDDNETGSKRCPELTRRPYGIYQDPRRVRGVLDLRGELPKTGDQRLPRTPLGTLTINLEKTTSIKQKASSISRPDEYRPTDSEERSEYHWTMRLPDQLVSDDDSCSGTASTVGHFVLPECQDCSTGYKFNTCHLARDLRRNCVAHPDMILSDERHTEEAVLRQSAADILIATRRFLLNTCNTSDICEGQYLVVINRPSEEGSTTEFMYSLRVPGCEEEPVENEAMQNGATRNRAYSIDLFIENAPDPIACQGGDHNHFGLSLLSLGCGKETVEKVTLTKSNNLFRRVFNSNLDVPSGELDICGSELFNLPNRARNCGFPYNPDSVPMCMPVRY